MAGCCALLVSLVAGATGLAVVSEPVAGAVTLGQPSEPVAGAATLGQPSEPVAGAATLGQPSGPMAGAASVEVPRDLLAGAPLALVWDAARGRGALALGDELLILQQAPDADGHPAGPVHLVTRQASGRLAHLALGPDDGTVYGSNPDTGELSALALVDGRLLERFPAGGPAPAAVFYHPVLRRLVSFNAGASTMTVFDVASRAFEGLIPLGDAPAAVAMAPDGRVLALLPERRELVLVGIHPLRIYARWPLPSACAQPEDLAVDPASARVFIACATADVTVFDLRSGDWPATWRTGIAESRVHQVLWDGVAGELLTVAEDGVIALASPALSAPGDAALAEPASGAPPPVQAVLPAGSLVALDAGAHRLIWAAVTAGGQLRLGATLLPTLATQPLPPTPVP